MNLLCSKGVLPDSGHLFFKVAGNTNVMNEFKLHVPGMCI